MSKEIEEISSLLLKVKDSYKDKILLEQHHNFFKKLFSNQNLIIEKLDSLPESSVSAKEKAHLRSLFLEQLRELTRLYVDDTVCYHADEQLRQINFRTEKVFEVDIKIEGDTLEQSDDLIQ